MLPGLGLIWEKDLRYEHKYTLTFKGEPLHDGIYRLSLRIAVVEPNFVGILRTRFLGEIEFRLHFCANTTKISIKDSERSYCFLFAEKLEKLMEGNEEKYLIGLRHAAHPHVSNPKRHGFDCRVVGPE